MTSPVVKLAAEGGIDIAVLKRLALDCGLTPGDEYGLRGKDHLDKRLGGYNTSARWQPWIVARDLDDCACAGGLCKSLLPVPEKYMRLRVAVRSIESWLLADRVSFAAAFNIGNWNVGENPELLRNPKQSTLILLLTSASRDIRHAMVRERADRPLEIGPEYNVRLVDFAQNSWNPIEAAKSSASLRSALVRISELSSALAT